MIGKTILHYRIVEKLGEGGMGVVYRALDTHLDRDVALKVLRTDQTLKETSRRRFLREAKSTSALNHAGIVTVYDVLSVEGTDLIVMEFVRGTRLGDLISRDGMPFELVLDYAVQIAEAVEAAHEAGVVHRDLKPGNIMVTPKGRVKVLDFGLAKRLKPDAPDMESATRTEPLTRYGAVMGTLAYMSPEQAAGEEVDARADIFSFGVILYEMLAGARPFKGDSSVKLLRQLYSVEPPPLSSLRKDVPEAVEGIIRRALMKDREQRYQSVDHVRRDLEAVVRRQPVAEETQEFTISTPASTAEPPDPGSDRASRPLRKLFRSQVFAIALVAVALVLLGFLVSSLWPDNSAEEAVSLLPAGVEPTPRNYYQQGRNLLSKSYLEGNTDRAIELFEKAIAGDREYALAYAGLAKAYLLKSYGVTDEQYLKFAEDNAREAVRLNEHLAGAHLALGEVLTETRDFPAAERALERALELDPLSARIHLAFGLLHQARNDLDQAQTAIEEVIRIDPADFDAHQSLGILHYRRGDYAAASASLKTATELAPDNVVAYRSLAAAYHMQDRYGDAAAALQAALEIQPSASLYTNLGTLLFFQGSYGQAVKAFEKSVELEANDYLSWGNLGDGYRWTPGNDERAAAAYANASRLARQSLRSRPDDWRVGGALAGCLAKSGDHREALAEIEKWKPQSRELPGLQYHLAVAAEVAGDRDQALELLDGALANGYAMREIQNDPELVELRSSRQYQQLILKHSPPRPSH